MAEENRLGRVQAHSGHGGLNGAASGVFDSGLGGFGMLRAELPLEHFIYFADTGNAPYGERSDAFVAARALEIAHQLHDEHPVAVDGDCLAASHAFGRHARWSAGKIQRAQLAANVPR